jgi:hypothetical protein
LSGFYNVFCTFGPSQLDSRPEHKGYEIRPLQKRNMRRIKLNETVWIESERERGLFWGTNELMNKSYKYYELIKMGGKEIKELKKDFGDPDDDYGNR